MRILTVENTSFDLDNLSNTTDPLWYCVLDCADKTEIDFQYTPLIFMETFYSPSATIKIGDYTLQMPLDWSVLICDEHYSDLEIVPITDISDRGFRTIMFNPLKHMVPITGEIDITNIYTDVQWFFPKIKNGSVLVVPLEHKETPLCALFVKEYTKLPDVIDIAELFK